MHWMLRQRERRPVTGASPLPPRLGEASGRSLEAGRVADDVVPAVGQVAERVRAPPRTGPRGDVRAAVVGRVERPPRDHDEGVAGIAVDADPAAGPAAP